MRMALKTQTKLRMREEGFDIPHGQEDLPAKERAWYAPAKEAEEVQRPESKLDARTKPYTRLTPKQQKKLEALFAELQLQEEIELAQLEGSGDEEDLEGLGFT